VLTNRHNARKHKHNAPISSRFAPMDCRRSERGGRTMAILSSFTSTCRRLSIDPQLYLTQLITNMPVITPEQLDHWLPDIWKMRLAPPPL